MTKIKEVNRTANIAWSPANQHPIYLAAGTAAQQLDATFSTTAELEIFHVDFGSKDLEMPIAGSLQCNQRLHKVIWGSHGMLSAQHSSGVIIGGTDNGHIFVYDAAKILAGDTDNALALQLDKHTGPVQALDINSFQENLLASGANDSEIYIWDLRKPENPLTPGAKSTPLDSVTCVHWNKQVQHIMASSSPSGRVVVWDLRKSEPIIKVGDTSAMLHCKSMAWHPEVATQMVIGNEDDRYPVIQLWDLRFATSPMKVLEGHQRGILSLDWCNQDPDLLMSCGKDNRILCWNPNNGQSGEIVYELPTTSQWSFEVSWCPRNPGILSTASFDGHVTVSSLMGGGFVPHASDKVASSFGSDAQSPHSPTAPAITPSAAPEPLKKPPRWMRRPCAASFAFGGRLVTFGTCKDDSSTNQVTISQVVTEEQFLERSKELENALLSNNLVEFCDKKIYFSSSETENTLWNFLKVNFDKEPRLRFLELLGYHPQELAKKVCLIDTVIIDTIAIDTVTSDAVTIDTITIDTVTTDTVTRYTVSIDTITIDTVTIDTVTINTITIDTVTIDTVSIDSVTSDTAAIDTVETISSISSKNNKLSLTDGMPDFDAQELASKMQLLNTGDASSVKSEGGLVISATASPAPGSGRKTPASEPDPVAAFEMVGNLSMDDSLNASISNLDDPGRPSSPLIIATDEDTDGLVSQALLTGNFDGAVDICFKANRMAEALILAVAGGPELFARTQKRYLHQARNSVSKLISCVVGRDWRSIVESCTIDNWKEALATLVTYGRAEEFFELCDMLGQRLESEASNYSSAAICYICSGNVERLVSCASMSLSKDATPLMLQDLIEKVMILKKAVEREKRQTATMSHAFLADKLSQYSKILASQGSYETAMVYLSTISDQSVAALKDRLLQAQGQKVLDSALPFDKVSSQMQPGYGYQNASPVQANPPASSNFFNPTSAINAYQGMYQPNQSQASAPSTAATQAPLYAPPSQMQPAGFHQYSTEPPPPASSGQFQLNQPPSSAVPPVNSAPPFAPGVSGGNAPPQAHFNQYGGQGFGMSQAQMVDNHDVHPLSAIVGYVLSGPPPPSSSSNAQPPMSLKAVKQETHHAPTQPLNMPLFNPAAQQPGQHQPDQNQQGQAPGKVPANEQKEKIIPEPAKQEALRPPIPAEHMGLQQTFNLMIEKCKTAANNPQTKRKLDDVTRRIECMYDMLREEKLSPNVLDGLHRISQACQVMNYPLGVQLHTEMVVRGNFSEISSFMPGLKTLMQIATQMRI
eukprot:gene12918-14250_t